jgi:hypothetical protein
MGRPYASMCGTQCRLCCTPLCFLLCSQYVVQPYTTNKPVRFNISVADTTQNALVSGTQRCSTGHHIALAFPIVSGWSLISLTTPQAPRLARLHLVIPALS